MTDSNLLESRWAAISARLVKDGADALVLSTGFDLVYLSTYEARASERLTAFVGRPGSNELPRMIVPKIEMPEVPKTSAFDVSGWTDDQDPIAMIVELIGDARRVLVSDEMWAHYLLRLKAAMPDTEFVSLSDSLGGLRSVKSDSEMQALQTVGGLANSVAAQIQRGDVALVGRTELEIQADVIEPVTRCRPRAGRVLHRRFGAEFCFTAPQPNRAGCATKRDRVVRLWRQTRGVLLRHHPLCLHRPNPRATSLLPTRYVKKAQQAAVDAARPGATLGDVDAAARSVIADAGFGDNFIHRTGHGIGTEVHEQPYVIAGNDEVVAVGHAFSIEPGIYLDGKWGMRLEDIVVILDDGALRCSTTDHDLVEVDA